jgi:hypothetical protein
MTLIEQSVRYFEEQLNDGFQIKDVTETVRFIGKSLVRAALDELPGSPGEEKSAFVKTKLYEIVDALSEAARVFFVSGITAILSPFLVESLKFGGRAVADWLMKELVEPFIKVVYLEEAVSPESPVISKGFVQAIA